MPYEFGDIVLVPSPFTNQVASKQRPAVVVTNRAYNRARPDVVLKVRYGNRLNLKPDCHRERR